MPSQTARFVSGDRSKWKGLQMMGNDDFPPSPVPSNSLIAIVFSVSQSSGLPVWEILGKYRGTAKAAAARDDAIWRAFAEGYSVRLIAASFGRDTKSIRSALAREAARRGQ